MAHLSTPNLLRFQREDLLRQDEAERIHAAAVRVLSEVGMEITQPEILDRLVTCGLRSAGRRVFFEPAMVADYVAEMRRTIAATAAAAAATAATADATAATATATPPPDDGKIGLHISTYPLYVHDLETSRVVSYTEESLIEMTKLVDSLAGDRVRGAPPGTPVALPPDLHQLAQYRIGCLYARNVEPMEPTSPVTVKQLLDMADVMGQSYTGLPLYLPTPLRLGGESLDCVLQCRERIQQVYVRSMPAAGTSAPLQPFGALTLAVAELIGGLIAIRLLTGLPATFSVNIFHQDLRSMAMVFGSPECMLFQMLSNDLNRFYGWQTGRGAWDIHNMAKLPGGQSAAERAMVMALGASLGTREFWCAGALSLDEIFSPEQLLLDCEIRDWVERAVRGVPLGETDVADWVEEIRAGLDSGYMNLDSTLDHQAQANWYPRRFDRGPIGPWLERDQPQPGDALRAEVRRRIARHNFELDPARRAALDKIYAAGARMVEG